ncbi:MAG: asparagine--tRNA ligase [Candidatus Nanoarchaeia archaeon]|nr:asparagine--tRNA ligase [Candidatus Nanoarchaeia archaeon]
MMKKYTIMEAIEKGMQEVEFYGWVHRERGSNKFKFINLRDSSGIIQCVFNREDFSDDKWEDIDKLLIESSLKIVGKLVEDKRSEVGYEIQVSDFEIFNRADIFPITKDQSPEFLADNRHLWIRSRKMIAIMKVRSTYVQARDEFFRNEKFYRFDTPILQPSQSEGGSTLFEVNYYDSKTYLAQTWQLYGEAAIFALEKVYDMGPTFRAEKSKTSRHLSEFWMAEMEAAWFDLYDAIDFAKKELKYCIGKVIENNSKELEFLGQNVEKLKEMLNREWPTIKYREALKVLKEKSGMEVEFGKDLRTVEEEKLMEYFETPVAVTHYPKEVMAFYKPSDKDNKDEALCFDMLAPSGYGEIVGGSQRDLDIEEMSKRLLADGEDLENYQWYFDLRRYGSVMHSGYGVGIERVIRWICNLENIKDAIAFPRTMLRFKP